MAFFSLEIIFFEQKQILHKLGLFIFVYLLTSIITERSHFTLSVAAKADVKHILRGKYGFTASKAFLTSYKLVFVCCLFVVLFATA